MTRIDSDDGEEWLILFMSLMSKIYKLIQKIKK